MVGRSRRVEAEVQMEEARVTVGEIPVRFGDIAKIYAPVGARQRQLDGRQRPVGDPPQQLVLRTEMVQDGHGIDAYADAKLTHGKLDFTHLRQHLERRIQYRSLVEAPAAARSGLDLACC